MRGRGIGAALRGLNASGGPEGERRLERDYDGSIWEYGVVSGFWRREYCSR